MLKSALFALALTALVVFTMTLTPYTKGLVMFPVVPVPATDSIVKNVDSIRVEKSERRLTVFYKTQSLKTYEIALGQNPVGHKQYQGDLRTPEGLYRIDSKNPNSAYHKNLGISYPNDADRAAARKLGKSPGGDIKIHGLANGYGSIGKAHLLSDWTLGCIALTDEEIDELYDAVPVGTPILILP
jgi:murein L,D-transpeptidase YafK